MECNTVNYCIDREEESPFKVNSQGNSCIPKKSLRESVGNKCFSSNSSGAKEKLGDRYIPRRHADIANRFLYTECRRKLDLIDNIWPQTTTNDDFPINEREIPSNYSKLLDSKLLEDEGESSYTYWQAGKTASTITSYPLKLRKNALQFKSEPRNLSSATSLGIGIDSDSFLQPSLNFQQRKINNLPYKVLDAPQLEDDFYLNLLDWSSQNFLAVGLESAVYTWSACTSKVTKLFDVDDKDDVITSVAWNMDGSYLAVGLDSGETQIWDAEQAKQIETFKGHTGRVSSLAWRDSMLSTGSRDRKILQFDLRCPDAFFARHQVHRQEVCGLKWSFNGMQLASGGNDNKLCLWDIRCTLPLVKFNDHHAAVKAIAWSPHQHNLLSSGGGTADRTIKFWNTLTCECIKSIDTGSQVCNLMFSKNNNELVSTHGYSLNQIIVWSYPQMNNIATLTGHTSRVIYLSMSPDGESIVTGAGDETLRFWNIFPPIKTKAMNIFRCSRGLILPSMEIR